MVDDKKIHCQRVQLGDDQFIFVGKRVLLTTKLGSRRFEFGLPQKIEGWFYLALNGMPMK